MPHLPPVPVSQSRYPKNSMCNSYTFTHYTLSTVQEKRRCKLATPETSGSTAFAVFNGINDIFSDLISFK